MQWRHVAPANTALAWTRDFVYDSATNRVTSVGIDGVGSATVTHDDFGQMTALPNIHELNWDASGRLRGSQRVSGATADRVWYVYDGGGQRVRKVSETWDAGASEWRPLASTTYVGGIDVVRSFVGGVLDEELQTLHCSDGSSGSGGGGRMLLVETRTVNAGVAVSSPVPLLRIQFDNHLGSACLETTEDGSILSYEEFHPYGTCAYSSGTATLDANPKRYRYSGKERDTESGLYYYGARYLAPWLGRWVSPDPSGFVDGVNVYAFVKGRPSSGWDAEGRQCYDSQDYFGEVDSSCIFEDGAQMRQQIAERPFNAAPVEAAAEVVGGAVESLEEGIWGALWLGEITRLTNPVLAIDAYLSDEELTPVHDIVCETVTGGSDETLTAVLGEELGLDTESGAWKTGFVIGTVAQIAPGGVVAARQAARTARRGVSGVQRFFAFDGFFDDVAFHVDDLPGNDLRLGSNRMTNDAVEAVVAIADEAASSSGMAAGAAVSAGTSIARIAPGALPIAEEAALLRTLEHIDAGTTPIGALAKKWGTRFKNWAGDLPGPSGPDSPYREFRVAPPEGTNGAGARRVVLNSESGEIYYTWTHYGDAASPAFVQIR